MNTTYSVEDTDTIAKEILKMLDSRAGSATVVGLTGDLGAGKTTLVKSIASILGVAEDVVSPTFVIAKFYDTNHDKLKRLVHVDAYRIEDPQELERIGWQDIISNNENLLVIEWPSKIFSHLPKNTKHFLIEHAGDTRTIKKYEDR
jgi:tRNA threonylcarbamoyladenosine biosynthesis protein TsaE